MLVEAVRFLECIDSVVDCTEPRLEGGNENDCGREGLLDNEPYRFDELSLLLSEWNVHVEREVWRVELDNVDIRLLFFEIVLARFAPSGSPSHFELVGGTKSGSF
jgi:hypothetical protein